MAITRDKFNEIIVEKGLVEGEGEYFLHGFDIHFVYDDEINPRGAKRQRVEARGIIPLSLVSDYIDFLGKNKLLEEVRMVSDVFHRAPKKQCGVKCSQVGFSGLFPIEGEPETEQLMNFIARLPINDPQALSIFIDTVTSSVIEKRITDKVQGAKSHA